MIVSRTVNDRARQRPSPLPSPASRRGRTRTARLGRPLCSHDVPLQILADVVIEVAAAGDQGDALILGPAHDLLDRARIKLVDRVLPRPVDGVGERLIVVADHFDRITVVQRAEMVENRLTDVVHFNERAGRLLPDYMYEYDSLNKPSQMISTEEGGNNYFIWKYKYNDKNLREAEKCFSREKRILGTIEYEYK